MDLGDNLRSASLDAGGNCRKTDLFAHNLSEHRALFQQLDALGAPVQAAGCVASGALRAGHKLMFCGNGGSAADSQHLASELTGRFIKDRRPLAAMALSTDSSALTCIGNDYAFDEVFARQVAALGRSGDVLVLGLNSDESVKRQGKGDDRPVNPYPVRAFVLAHLESDSEIGVLVLGAAAGKAGPGPLVSRLLRDLSTLPCAITLIPGDLSRERLEAIS